MHKLKVVVLGYGFGLDHLHLFLSNVRFVSEVELVMQIKGYSLYMMWKNFNYLFKTKLYGEKFWSEGHFYRGVGDVNSETIKHYVEESQDKYWETKPIIPDEVIVLQKRINEF